MARMKVRGVSPLCVLLLVGCHLLMPYEPAERAPEAGVEAGPDRSTTPPDRSTRPDTTGPIKDKKVQPLDKKVQPLDKKVQPLDKGQPCAKGQTLCGKTCVTLDTDPQNCGACGNICNDNNQCTDDVCTKNKCDALAKKVGTKCSVGACAFNASVMVCCAGCLDGTTCRTGTGNSRCGKGGVACTNCTKNGAKKTCDASTGTCTLGTTTSCMVNCVSKCCEGPTCYPGTSSTHCGKANSPCADCTKKTATDCTQYYCATTRVCDTKYKPDSTPCTGGMCCKGVCKGSCP